MLSLSVFAAFALFAIEDEPEELNWDIFGGSETGFDHFVKYCAENPEFKKKLLAEKALDPLEEKAETIWITPEAFDKSPVKSWGLGRAGGETVITTGPGHLSGISRIGVDIPKTGRYRIWVKYWHEQGTSASFTLSIEDGFMADEPDPWRACIEDKMSWTFDWCEHARKQNPLPTHQDEPTGFIWESKAPVLLEKGRVALSVGGMIHGGPFASRCIAAIVLTRNPLGQPERPDGAGPIITGTTRFNRKSQEIRELWKRRPMIAEGSGYLKPYWRVWRKQFLADLLDGKMTGFEAKRMLTHVYFDETSNLLGTPAQVRDEKLNMRKLLKSMELRHWTRKAEGEDFRLDDEGWTYEDDSEASGGKILQGSWDDEEANAYAEFEAPSNGMYTVWIRYHEIPGYSAPFEMFIDDKEGDAIVRRTFCTGEKPKGKDGEQKSGYRWANTPVELPGGPFTVTLSKNSEGLTSRKIDSVIVTDDKKYVPTGVGMVVAPLDRKKPFTVWVHQSPWIGYDRLSTPGERDNLDPIDVVLREGEAQTILLLVRNNSMKIKEATPVIKHDPLGMIQWRVPAFMQTGWYGWQPVPLLERDNLFVPGCETAGLWLTIHGKKGFKDEEKLKISVGGQNFEMRLIKLPPYDPYTPVPYVFGWASPMPRRMCWDMFKSHGINVIGDMLVDKKVAVDYGVRLTVHLNDADVSWDHVKWMTSRFEKAGYSKSDWAWSFMDEPGDKYVDGWVECAKTLKDLDPNIQIWVNPGEWEGCSPKAALKMTPYADVYCPYGNHIWSGGVGNPDYYKQLMREPDSGVDFKILLSYTTPCFAEKAANSPMDFFWLKGFTEGANLDGFAFFALCHAFTYSNSIWDEIDTYMPDQCVNYYPGVYNRIIATRNLEAIREAVQQWRGTKDDIIATEREANAAAAKAEKKEKAARKALRERIRKVTKPKKKKPEDNPAAKDMPKPDEPTMKIQKTVQ